METCRRKTPQVSTLGSAQRRAGYLKKTPILRAFLRPHCRTSSAPHVGGNWKLETQTGNLSLAKACAERPRNQSVQGRTRDFNELKVLLKSSKLKLVSTQPEKHTYGCSPDRGEAKRRALLRNY